MSMKVLKVSMANKAKGIKEDAQNNLIETSEGEVFVSLTGYCCIYFSQVNAFVLSSYYIQAW